VTTLVRTRHRTRYSWVLVAPVAVLGVSALLGWAVVPGLRPTGERPGDLRVNCVGVTWGLGLVPAGDLTAPGALGVLALDGGQRDREPCAAEHGIAVDGDAPVEFGHDLIDDGQAQSRSGQGPRQG